MSQKPEVEKTVQANYQDKNMVTTTQLRLLLSNSVIVKNKIEMERIEGRSGETLSAEVQNDIRYLLIKHIYQCGRDANVKKFDELFKIQEQLKGIGNSKERFDEYYRYLEEIVAYVKYYKG